MQPPPRMHLGEAVCVHWCRPFQAVGGDAFDLVRDPSGTWHLLLADAMGHGVAAGLLVSFLRGIFLSRLQREHLTPRDMAVLVDEGLKGGTTAGDDAPFCTVVHLAWDPRRSLLSCVNAAGAPVLLLRASGAVDVVEATMPMLGVLPVMPEERELRTAPGDVVCCCSDGFLEALPGGSGREAVATLALWLRDVLAQENLEDLPQRIQHELDSGHWSLRDDATLVILRLGAHGGDKNSENKGNGTSEHAA